MSIEVANQIIALERSALDRWGSGDPSGFLELVSDDVSYFDPFQGKRLDGLERLAALYESVRGQIHITQSEIVDPRVQVVGDVAVFTFQFFSQGSEGRVRWNSTEVYRRMGRAWRIIHSHWSFVQPKLAPNGS